MAIVVAVSSIMLAWLVNPWFNLFRNAFSDLGGPIARNPWIFNYGLVASSVLAILYSLWLFQASINKLECAGSAFAFIGGVFLALIGLFPSSTYPHRFVSTWFFVQMGLAIATWGIGLIYRGARVLGLGCLLIVALGFVAALLIKWPSIAVLESVGIAAIAIWITLMFKVS